MVSKIFLLFLIIHTMGQPFPKVRPRTMKTMWHREFHSCSKNDSTEYAKLIEGRINTFKGGITTITVRAEVLKPIRGISKIVVFVERCWSYAERRCENSYTFVFKNICYLMSLPNQIWSPVVKKIQPPHYQRCPFKKGRLEVVNATASAEAIATVVPVLEGYYWRIKFTGHDGDKLLGCIVYGGQVTTVRVNY